MRPAITAEKIVELVLALVRRTASLPADEPLADPECLAIASDLLAVFRRPPSTSTAPGRRGRPPVHDAEWARSVLTALALENPDGLPQERSVMAMRLANAFEEAGRAVPGETWLTRAVAKFYAAAKVIEDGAVNRYRNSPDLQAAFGDETAFVAWRKTSIMLERQWYGSPELQSRYATPQDYIQHRTASRFRGNCDMTPAEIRGTKTGT